MRVCEQFVEMLLPADVKVYITIEKHRRTRLETNTIVSEQKNTSIYNHHNQTENKSRDSKFKKKIYVYVCVYIYTYIHTYIYIYIYIYIRKCFTLFLCLIFKKEPQQP